MNPNEPIDPNEPLKPIEKPTNSTESTVGRADLEPPGHPVKDPETEGMLIGPHNPIFNQPVEGEEQPSFVPPGARYDPIDPFNSSGDPDFDEFIPQGGFGDVGNIRGRGASRGRAGSRGRGGNVMGFDPSSSFGNSGSFNPFGGL